MVHVEGIIPASRLFLLWAKIGRNKTDTFANRHPLPCHCIDVGKTAALLYERVLCPSLKNRLVAAFGGSADAKSIGRWFAFWAACHDIGKAAPGFESKRQDAVPPLQDAGFDFTCGKDHPHQFISSHVLAAELPRNSASRPQLSESLARRIGIAVGGHHGLFPTSGQWNNEVTTDVLGQGQWGDARRLLIDQLAEVFGLAGAMSPVNPTGPDKHWPMMVLAGLISVADWIGSNKCFFPHAPETADARAYAARAETRALTALQQLGWLGWSPSSTAPKPFSGLFPFPPRPLQEAVIAAADSASGPTLMIVEAPMGEGKTEAALYVADQCIHRLGGQGLYVAMPTMATGNQMFGRVTGFLTKRYPQDVVNLQLLHSGSMLSDAFEQRQRDAEVLRQSFQPADVGEDTSDRGAVVAETWFAQNKKQAILAPFGVGTIDQALLSILQVKHGFVRLFGLAGKTVILDEVHAYDTYMSTLLARLLEWLSALGCSVVLLSATLPADKRRSLVRSWTGQEPQPDQTAYPRLTVAGSGGPTTVTHFRADPSRDRTIEMHWKDRRTLAADLESALSAGGCAAVIRNTVGEAQQTFVELRDRLRPFGFDVRLFHARFPFEDRQRIEDEVLRIFGKATTGQIENPLRPHKAVVVATQVIEQSLDLDFDLMVSDLAPGDLVLQRAGRLHRHDRTNRPIKAPTLWLLKPDGFDAIPAFGNHQRIYDRYVLLRSFLVLVGRETLRLPHDIDAVVKAVYNDSLAVPGVTPEWVRSLEESLAAMLEKQGRHEDFALQFCISKPVGGKAFVQFERDLDEEDPDRSPEQRASTRLPDGISVQTVFLHEASPLVSLKGRPTAADARGLLRRVINVQGKPWPGSLVQQLLDEPVPMAWRDNAILRYCRLVKLNSSSKGSVGPMEVTVDTELGLVMTNGKGE